MALPAVAFLPIIRFFLIFVSRTVILLDVTVLSDTVTLLSTLFGVIATMRPVRRSGVSKKKSSSKFRKQVGRTKSKNIAPPPQRGGFRL